jgi:hypothetical protein
MSIHGIDDLEKRLNRLEQQFGRTTPRRFPQVSFHPAWPFLLGLAGVVLGFLGVGYPHHYYQVLFSILLLMLLYHRGRLLIMPGKWKWPLIVVNFGLLCLLFQFLIGGGITHPFDWIKVPVIHDASSPQEKSWYSAFVPDFRVQWQALPGLAEWEVDVTKIQTFLLLTVLAGALFRFEPFTSIAALVLLVISLPVYLRFNWDWIIPFITAASVCLYLQAGLPRTASGGGKRREPGQIEQQETVLTEQP